MKWTDTAAHKAAGDNWEECRRNAYYSKEETKRLRIRVCHRTKIPPFSHSKVALSTLKSRMIAIEALLDDWGPLKVERGIEGDSK